MERKIKVLFSVPRFSVGGAEKFLVHHLAHIDRNAYEVTMVTIFDEQQGASCADQARIDRCFHARSIGDISAFFKMLAFVRRGHFDVVVTHLFTANLLVRIAAILARVPVIISYEHNIYPNKRWWQIFVDKILSLWTDRIIVDSDAARRFTAQQEFIPLDKFLTIVIPPLLDKRQRRTREQVLSELRIQPDSLIVVTVSRLVVDKGHKYLVEAAPQVLEKHPNAYFLIGGWGPLKEELEAQVKRLGISEHVRILGRVDGQEFMSLADLYVDPSISTDLPIGIMEAMTMSKAIVATIVGEIPNFVQNEKTGLVVPPGDMHALVAAIDRVLGDESLRKQYGEAGKRKVGEYSMENYTRTFDELIHALVENK